MNPAPLSIPKDTEKLKKHIALVCDRLGKGAKLTEGLYYVTRLFVGLFVSNINDVYEFTYNWQLFLLYLTREVAIKCVSSICLFSWLWFQQ